MYNYVCAGEGKREKTGDGAYIFIYKERDIAANAHKTIPITMTTTYSILHILFLGILLLKKFYFILFPLDRCIVRVSLCMCVSAKKLNESAVRL